MKLCLLDLQFRKHIDVKVVLNSSSIETDISSKFELMNTSNHGYALLTGI